MSAKIIEFEPDQERALFLRCPVCGADMSLYERTVDYSRGGVHSHLVIGEPRHHGQARERLTVEQKLVCGGCGARLELKLTRDV